MNEPRTYKNSTFQIIFAVGILLLILTGILFDSGFDLTFRLIILVFFLMVIASVVSSLLQKTIISDDEIITQTVFRTSTLRWSEISRVSPGSGYAIKLHNLDGDTTVTPNPQLPGYEEVIEIIGAKRPDLFSPQEYNELPRNWSGILPLFIVAAILLVIGISVFFLSGQSIFSFVFFIILGIAVLGMIFLAPQSATIERETIVINSLTGQKTLRANEVSSVTLGYTKTRNGKNYFVQLRKTDGGNVRVSNLRPNVPIAYLILKNWHRQYA